MIFRFPDSKQKLLVTCDTPHPGVPREGEMASGWGFGANRGAVAHRLQWLQGRGEGKMEVSPAKGRVLCGSTCKGSRL